MELEAIINQLPVCDLVTSEQKPKGVSFCKEENPFFVSPYFTEIEEEGGDEKNAIIISAPAAVGKTTIAKEIAYRTNAPLWDLSEFIVGTRTFLGTLTDTYGTSYEQVLARIVKGEYLVVIDAFDEGLVKSGEQGFKTFLEELCSCFTGPSGKVSIVLLARTRTAETIQLHLMENGIRYKHYIIEYFDEQKAREFIDKRHEDYLLKNKKKRQRLYEDVRERLFERVIETITTEGDDPWLSPNLKNFLGYGPVLVAMAKYLEHDNYRVLLNELNSIEEDSAWEFLAEVIEKLLDRETKKILKILSPVLKPVAKTKGWERWDRLFGADEQCLRVVSIVYGTGKKEIDLADIPNEVREVYEERISEQIGQHPFISTEREIANVVFEEYLFGRLLARGFSEHSDRILAYMGTERYLPKPLFGRFFLNYVGKDNGSANIPINYVGILFESFLSQRAVTGEISLGLTESPDNGGLVGELTIDNGIVEVIPLSVEDTGDDIVFYRQLNSATIIAPISVVIGINGSPFILGPDVFLEISSFGCLTTDLVIRSGTGDSGGQVIVIAANLSAPEVIPEFKPRYPTNLRVYWPNIRWPWTEFQIEDYSPSIDISPVIMDVFRHFRSWCIYWFRAEGYRGLGVYIGKVETILSNRPPILRKFFDFLLDREVFYKDGVIYRLNISPLNMSYNDVVMGKPSAEFAALISDFLDTF